MLDVSLDGARPTQKMTNAGAGRELHLAMLGGVSSVACTKTCSRLTVSNRSGQVNDFASAAGNGMPGAG
jgi:hypothetical protein